MKITLSGYGRMGKEIEKAALGAGHSIVATVDNPREWQAKKTAIAASDVIIDFSLPSAVLQNISNAFEMQIPVVVGTTGWYESLDSISERCKSEGHTLIWASNFSIGVNIFFRLNQYLAQMMARHNGYRPAITEIHHTGKIDSPSGTAITLAEGIIKNRPGLHSWINNGEPETGQIAIISERKENVPGTHIVEYQSDIDNIAIKHTAHSRQGFARGAVLAAEMTKGLKGFYNFADLLFNKA